MTLLAAALIVAGALVWASLAIVAELRRRRGGAAAPAQMLGTFAQGLAAAQADPRALLVWQPLARTARALLPEAFAELDRAFGGEFPFDRPAIEAAHARWTADWLAWERSHDAEFRAKAAVAERELAASGESPVVRAKLEAVERERLETYQRRYEEYIRTAKALQALMPPS
ncbi:MAG: hypothetical protein IT176_08935 [Acidobacteria bacterium]|nr:hypothetical protein [Acidobacteriota bacterium]